ncbi:MAG: inositol phosphorylceramide synthase [Actinobacteria bacterium]|nr:inositol phosphorylceramide synthase [Actinomycetota bacterium]
MGRIREVVIGRDGTAQVVLALVAVESYELLRRLLHPDWPLAIRHAHDIFALERFAHLDIEAATQALVIHMSPLVVALDLFYLAAHWVVTAAFLVWLFRRSRASFAFYRDALLGATALALAVHAAFPAAPPRLAGLGIDDTVRSFFGLDIGSPQSAPFSNPVAALPSLHAGWALAVGVGVASHARRRAVRWLGLLYPAVVVFATIATGNHFVIDAVAGMAVVVVGFGAAAFSRRGSRPATGSLIPSLSRRGVEQPGSSPGS